MSNVSCPRCGDSFRLPDTDIPPGASARCPWCGDTLPVAQLLSSLPPVAQLIGGDGEPLSGTAAAPQWDRAAGLQLDDDTGLLDDASLFDSADLQDEASLQREPDPRGAETAEFAELSADGDWDQHDSQPAEELPLEFGEPAAPRPLSEVADVSFDPDHQRLNTRGRTKKKPSSIRSILGIAIGGLMAFPLAAIILALLGKPLDLGFWPFDGRTIATGTSARMVAPAATTGGDVPTEQRPAPPQGRSLAHDLPRELSSNGVIQADHDSLSPPHSDSLPAGDSADTQDRLLAGAGERAGTGTPRPVLGGRPSGPEWVEPLAIDEDAVELMPQEPASQPPLATESASQDPASQDPAPEIPSPSFPELEIAELAMPELDTPELDLAELEPAEQERVDSDAAALQLPDLEEPATDSPIMVPQLDVPPSIDAAVPGDLEESAVELSETQSEGMSIEPSETSAESEAIAEAAADATTAVDNARLAAEQADAEQADAEQGGAEVDAEPTTNDQAAADEPADVEPADDAMVELTQPQASSPQLQASLELAEASLEAVRDYIPAEGTTGLKRRLATLYAHVAAVGEVAEPQDEALVSGLVDRLRTDDLIKDLAPAAPNWFRYSQRPNNGLLAVGELRQENDKWFVAWSGAQPLEIRSRGAELPAAGTPVLVLGRLVSTDPAAPAVEPTYLAPLQ